MYRYIGTIDLALPDVSATLNDENGSVLATTNATGIPSIVKPGSLMPFRALFHNPPKNWRKFTIQPQSHSAEINDMFLESYYSEFEVLQSQMVPGGLGLKVVGEVRNKGNRIGNLVEVSGVIYDKEGKVLDVAVGVTKFYNIPPGDTSAFEIEFTHHKSAERYDLVVSAFSLR